MQVLYQHAHRQAVCGWLSCNGSYRAPARIEICELAGSSDYDLEDVMDTLYELAKEEKNPDDLTVIFL